MHIDDEEITGISVFWRVAEMDVQHLAGSRNVSVDLKYDVRGGEGAGEPGLYCKWKWLHNNP